jgi:type IX secretion system PorP/SprF family membrane protein
LTTNLKYILVLSVFLLGSREGISQHNIIYRYNHLHQVFINPATAGSEFFPVACLSYQKQWLGINQSPSNILASASLRMGNFDFYNPKMFINTSDLRSVERIGMGLGVYSDQNGPVYNRGISLAYAYHLTLKETRLSFGLSANAEQSVLNESTWDPTTPGDPLLGNGRESYYHFNANAGVYIYAPKYYAGFAATHLIPLEDKLNPGQSMKQDFLLHGGYLFRSSEKFKFEPSVNIRYLDLKEFEFDIRAKAYLNHTHWVALTYRSYLALNLSAGMKIKGFYVAYHFEANLSQVIKYNAGTHGLHIGMNLGMRRLEAY